MLVLLSPSKTQDFSPADCPLPPTQPELLDESQMLVKELRMLSAAQIGKLMGVSEKLADLNHRRYKDFAFPFTPENAKPAALAFRGDVYDGLDAPSFSEEELEFAQGTIRILSGLYGVLRPLDLIQPYRLEMKTPLQNLRGKDLYVFWGDRLTTLLNRHMAKEETDMVVNLASQEYFAAVNTDKLDGRLVTVHFKERRDGKLKVIGLFAKKARGMMARYIVQNKLTDVKRITHFDEDGYAFEPELSSDTEFVFARNAG